ncbi:MAG: hypothetical protein HYV18_01485 [Gammaproteobacteria bacterium]|nr:hypothetical protein [Gammaproteobacteria bacterium]
MRTTLDIDRDVLAAAKELAQRQHKTAGQVISELARRALTTPTAAIAEPTPVHGFRPFASRGAVVTDEAVGRLRDEAGI